MFVLWGKGCELVKRRSLEKVESFRGRQKMGMEWEEGNKRVIEDKKRLRKKFQVLGWFVIPDVARRLHQ